MRRKLFPFACLLVGIYVGLGLMLRAADHQKRASEAEDQLRATLDLQETPLFAAAAQNNLTEVDRLLKAGADPNETDRGLRTPLLTAARVGNLEVVKRLMAAGAHIDAQDRTGSTALLYAIKTDRNPAVTAYLLAHGADAGHKDHAGETPLLMACDNADTDLMEAILFHGADVNVADRLGLTPLMRIAHGILRERYKRNPTIEPGIVRQSAMELLLRHGADIQKQDLQGWTALLYASENEPSEGVKVLLRHGADPNISVKGRTPLRNAAYRGLVGNLQALLDGGAKGSPENFSDALMQAALTGHDAAVLFLLDHGADANYCDQYGVTPLMLAIGNGHLSAGRVLVKHGASARAHDLLGKTAIDYAPPERNSAVRREVFGDAMFRRF